MIILNKKNLLFFLLLFFIKPVFSNSELETSLKHFKNSIVLYQDSIDFEPEFRSAVDNKLDPEIGEGIIKKIVQMRKEALNEAKLVNLKHLKKLHKNLPKNYKNKFIKGLEFNLYVWENPGVFDPESSEHQKKIYLLREFGNWYKKNLLR